MITSRTIQAARLAVLELMEAYPTNPSAGLSAIGVGPNAFSHWIDEMDEDLADGARVGFVIGVVAQIMGEDEAYLTILDNADLGEPYEGADEDDAEDIASIIREISRDSGREEKHEAAIEALLNDVFGIDIQAIKPKKDEKVGV